MKTKILFIINPIAGVGSKHRVPDKIERFLDTRKFEYEIYYTQGRGHAAELAAKAVQQGIDIVAVGGGDGSVNEVAGSLVGSNSALAILPLGSGNGLARHLGYSTWVKSTLAVINAFQVARLDVGMVNDKHFFSLIGIGFDAYVAKLFDREETRGFMTYGLTSLKSLRSYEGFYYTLQTEGGVKLEEKAFMINICNSNQYGYNVRMAPDANPMDGWLNVMAVNDFPRLLVPSLLWKLFRGTHLSSHYIEYFKAKTISIRCSRKTYLQIDGETQGQQDRYEVKLSDKKLNVLVNPQKFQI